MAIRRVYEFDDDDIAPGHIAVDISGGAPKLEAAAALANAINNSTTEPVFPALEDNVLRVIREAGGSSV